ncbi:hypothetical protein GCM10009767_28210 [Kocuria aegyptia]|uniref:Uncharacterized protein n=1 Tax=Kocuria aegyptia TaxID=330943 RepID=A0ABP4X1T3_9MICC
MSQALRSDTTIIMAQREIITPHTGTQQIGHLTVRILLPRRCSRIPLMVGGRSWSGWQTGAAAARRGSTQTCSTLPRRLGSDPSGHANYATYAVPCCGDKMDYSSTRTRAGRRVSRS